MFEIIKAFHEALRTENTWPFVVVLALLGALVFGLGAWVVDIGYKRRVEALSDEAIPAIDFDFRPEFSTPPTIFLTIVDRGEFPLRDVKMETTVYTLQHHSAITSMSKVAGTVPIARQIGSRGGESKTINLREVMPALQFLPSPANQGKQPVAMPPQELFYALRFTFLHGGKKRFCFYKVVSALNPHLLSDESTSAWGWSAGVPPQHNIAKAWMLTPRKLILQDQRSIPWPDNAEEYTLVRSSSRDNP
jgi:hypothetical protein